MYKNSIDNLNHLTCCQSDNVSLCDKDMSDSPFELNLDITCRVCSYLEYQPFCPLLETCELYI